MKPSGPERRVLMLCYEARLAEDTGFGKRILHQVRLLSRRGLRLVLVTFDPNAGDGALQTALAERYGPFVEETIVLRRPATDLAFPVAILRGVAAIRAAQADQRLPRWLIHAHGVFAAYIGLQAKRLSGNPVFYDEHGITVEEIVETGRVRAGSLQHRLVGAMHRAVVRHSEGIFGVSERHREYFAGVVPGAEQKTYVVPSGVDCEAFRPWPQEAAEVRKTLGISPEARVAIFVGALNPAWQRASFMVRVFQAMRAQWTHSHFLGLSHQVDELRSALDDGGLPRSSYTVLSVDHEDVPRYLSAADVGLLLRDQALANSVASPVKFGEYLACGVPVLATPGIGDIEQMIAKHNVGWVIRQREGPGLEAALREAMAGIEADREGLRTRCQRAAREHFDWNTLIQTVLRAYDDRAGGTSGVER